MGNRPVEKVPLSRIVTEGIRKNFSLRALAGELGVSDRTIRYWLNRHEMPSYLWRKLIDVVYPKTKKIWIRIGVSVPVTEDELYFLMKESKEGRLKAYGRYGFEDVDLGERMAQIFLERGKADGESYIPGCSFNEHEDWFQKQKELRGE